MIGKEQNLSCNKAQRPASKWRLKTYFAIQALVPSGNKFLRFPMSAKYTGITRLICVLGVWWTKYNWYRIAHVSIECSMVGQYMLKRCRPSAYYLILTQKSFKFPMICCKLIFKFPIDVQSISAYACSVGSSRDSYSSSQTRMQLIHSVDHILPSPEHLTIPGLNIKYARL